jgi:uncharacterized protein (DUF2336 family)
MRKKDVVLMATVTSFESLPHPSRSELRQFAELFTPLFSASTEEARRQAVASLSQSEKVPAAVAFFIASQPISISAPFLISSPCLTNEALIAIARTQGLDHARAISRREQLSPIVVDALVGMRYDSSIRRKPQDADPMPGQAVQKTLVKSAAAPALPDAPAEAMAETRDRLAREEQLRRRIKLLAGHTERAPDDRLGLRQVSQMQAALMVRFARNRETSLFCGVLADTLSASHWLAERIMLDISGHQLATTLKGLFMDEDDAVFILEKLYNHLSEDHDGRSRATVIWNMLDTDDSGRRLEAWRRADGYTYAQTQNLAQHQLPAKAEVTDEIEEAEDQAQRPFRTSASIRRSVRGR